MLKPGTLWKYSYLVGHVQARRDPRLLRLVDLAVGNICSFGQVGFKQMLHLNVPVASSVSLH